MGLNYRPYSFKSRSRPAADKKAMAEYREAHPICEGCQGQASTATHHINTEKSGGPTEDWNFLALCWTCHETIHRVGMRKFIYMFPWTGDKISAARLRMGRKIK